MDINNIMKKYNCTVKDIADVLHCTPANVYMKKRKSLSLEEYTRLDILISNLLENIKVMYKKYSGDILLKDIQKCISTSAYNQILVDALITHELTNIKITRLDNGKIDYIDGVDCEGNRNIYHFTFKGDI